MSDFKSKLVSTMPDAIYQTGADVFIDAALAMKVVSLAEAANVAILGIEGFMVREPSVYPSFDRLADFSRTMEPDHAAAVRQTCAQARTLLTTSWAEKPQGAPEGQMHSAGVGGRYMFVFVFRQE